MYPIITHKPSGVGETFYYWSGWRSGHDRELIVIIIGIIGTTAAFCQAFFINWSGSGSLWPTQTRIIDRETTRHSWHGMLWGSAAYEIDRVCCGGSAAWVNKTRSIDRDNDKRRISFTRQQFLTAGPTSLPGTSEPDQLILFSQPRSCV